MGMIEWGKNQNSQKSLRKRASNKTQNKYLDQKLTPNNPVLNF